MAEIGERVFVGPTWRVGIRATRHLFRFALSLDFDRPFHGSHQTQHLARVKPADRSSRYVDAQFVDQRQLVSFRDAINEAALTGCERGAPRLLAALLKLL